MILIFLIITFSLILFVFRIRRKRLKSYTSDILGLIEVWEKFDGEKVLTINKYPHGISIEDPKSYWYFIAEQTIDHISKRKNSQVLFFGLGANTSSSIINRYFAGTHQTIIEIDKHIIQACKDYFHLNEMKNLTLIKGDAYSLVRTRKDFLNKFDVIVVDIFTGIPPYVSTKTNQPPFIQSMLLWLKKDGRVIFNRPANIAADRVDTKKLATYLKNYFIDVDSVYIRDPRAYENDIIIATFLR